MPTPAALEGVRVVDLSRLYPGPVATWMLVRLGAEVIKVEGPGGGDYLRHLPPQVGGTNPAYRALNEGKRHMVLDLRRPEAGEVLHRLLARADVLVDPFRPGVLARLGFSPEALADRYPGLILASITGYGQSGPKARHAGHDLTYLAMAGLLTPPPRSVGGASLPSFQAADIAGGAYYAVTAILAALLRRARTGRGAHLDIAMAEGALPLNPSHLGRALLAAGRRAQPPPGDDPDLLGGRFACYTTYRCADGRHLAVAALEPKFWRAFCVALGRPEWIPLALSPDRAEALRAEVARHLEEQPAEHWLKLLEPADCCVEPLLDPEDLPAHPHHKARGLFGSDGALRLAALEALGAEEAEGPRPSTVRGSATREILGEIGYAAAEIEEIIRSGSAEAAS